MKHFTLIFILLLPIFSVAQQPVVDKVVAEICDSLEQKDVQSLTRPAYIQILKSVLIANYSQWVTEFQEYKEETGNNDYDFELYFQHMMEQKCHLFRIINSKFDTYVQEKAHERKLYDQAKQFVYAMEDEMPADSLIQYFNDSLRNDDLKQLFSHSASQISQIKRNSTVSVMMIYTNGYTLRIRYFDYKTNAPLFHMDLIYTNSDDLFVDGIEYIDRKELKEDWLERKEYNRKVKSGEIQPELPPPPPPPGN